ncbi:MAG: putative ABC transporter permease [Bacilli bacterium]|nr:putative ABC transporter permease [Bacilli bacterium]
MFNAFYSFLFAFALFIIYAFIGWIIEIIVALINNHKFINRGFLMGPIIPIWGLGAMMITWSVKPSDSVLSLIISSAFIGTFLEYIVNYIMEKLFKARWWDYSNLPFNIEGRVWLGSSLLFGVGGFLLIRYMNPFFISLLSTFNKSLLCVSSLSLLLIMIVDICISGNIIKNLKLSAYSLRKDYTEEVSKKVKMALKEKSYFFNRLLKAFPDVKFLFKNKK